MIITKSYRGKVLGMSQQCPFLSTVEDKVDCFNECSFFEYEGSGEGCPFKKVKGNKTFSIKDLLNIDLDRKDNEVLETMEDFESNENYIQSIFTKEYL
jgi:hypothetical protein